MNLLQLKYIVEVEKTQSITRAADNLYMGQPNLSRSIRELEDTLGFSIFRRTSKGMIPTQEGEEVLFRAKKVLSQIEAIEDIGKQDYAGRQVFSISVPRVSYISHAFTSFVSDSDLNSSMEFDYQETNSMQAIENVLDKTNNLAIIRYRAPHENSFISLFKEKDLDYELISEFTHKVLMSERHPLATKEKLGFSDLKGYIELIHGDPSLPAVSPIQAKQMEISESGNKKIYLYERGGQFDLLCAVPLTYMWVSPIPLVMLKRQGLVMKDCGKTNASWIYKDVLIHRKNHRLTDLDKRFIDEVFRCQRLVFYDEQS